MTGSRGFTLIETLVALMLGGAALSLLAGTAWMMTAKTVPGPGLRPEPVHGPILHGQIRPAVDRGHAVEEVVDQ